MCVIYLMHTSLNACNICGCSVSTGNPGILPNFRSHIVGFRESYRSFTNEHPVSILNPEKTYSSDVYSVTELWGRWNPLKRLQVFGSLPYNKMSRQEDGKTEKRNGFGDLSLLANFILFNNMDSVDRRLRQVITAGIGSKLNTGKYIYDGLPYFQAGSGAIDYKLYVSYTLSKERSGIMTELSGLYTGSNPENYNSGNKLNASIKYYSRLGKKNAQFLPHLGFMHEVSGRDHSNGILQDYTGGRSTLAAFGLDTYWKQFTLGFSAQAPIAQHLGDGLVKENTRIQCHLAYIIKTNSCK